MNTLIFEPEILVRHFEFWGETQTYVHYEELLNSQPITEGFLRDDSIIEMNLVKAGTRTETYSKRYKRG